jgi:hypothetical protein
MTLQALWTHLDSEMDSLSQHFRDFAAAKPSISSATDFSVLDECLLEGVLSRTWQTWSNFCRSLVVESCMGTVDASGKSIIALPDAISDAHVSSAAIRAKSNRNPCWGSANTNTILRLEPTWGDVDVLDKILKQLQPNNAAQLLAAFSSGYSSAKAMQTIRNGAAHNHRQNLLDIQALASAYIAFPITHATHSLFWTEPTSGDFLVAQVIEDLRSAGLAAIT